MIDKEGRLLGKINVLDFLVLVFLAIIFISLALKFFVLNSRDKTPTPMQVTVYIDDVQPNVANEVKEVKEVYFGRGLVKTNVEKVEVLPMPAGSRRPDFKEVRITLSGEGYKYEDGAYFGNQRVSLGKRVWLRSRYELETIVMSVK